MNLLKAGERNLMQEVTIIPSDRKSVSLQVNPDLTVTMRVPKWLPKREIQHILEEKQPWIQKNIEKMQRKQAEREGEQMKDEPLTEADIHALVKEAREVITEKASAFAEKMGVTYGRISIRKQRTRWGSCSSKGNLNFNCLLMLTPPEVVDYVVVHELCHRKEMNHSKAFWTQVEKVLPEYREARKWLRDNGGDIMRRIDKENFHAI